MAFWTPACCDCALEDQGFYARRRVSPARFPIYLLPATPSLTPTITCAPLYDVVHRVAFPHACPSFPIPAPTPNAPCYLWFHLVGGLEKASNAAVAGRSTLRCVQTARTATGACGGAVAYRGRKRRALFFYRLCCMPCWMAVWRLSLAMLVRFATFCVVCFWTAFGARRACVHFLDDAYFLSAAGRTSCAFMAFSSLQNFYCSAIPTVSLIYSLSCLTRYLPGCLV